MAVCALRYNLSVTGDCTNIGDGAFTLNIQGSSPPFYYQFLAPFDDPIPIALGAGVTSFTRTNLTTNTYTFLLFDSCSPPTQQIVTAIISDGVCVSLSGHRNTTCNLPNGAITARTDNNLQLTQYFLYENTIGYVTSGSSPQDEFVFNNLSAGTYYVTVNDGGGCSGRSESCIIKSSTPLDYGFYVVADSPCTSNTGKIFITGTTGYPPYTYSWSTGGIGSSISGLTRGSYSVTVIDSTGCRTSKNVQVGQVPAVGFAEIITIAPSCFGTDGQITVVITGGTAPYNYQASNGQSQITFSETFTMSGLGSNNYSITVTDAALCSATITQALTPPNGFTILDVGIVNSTCNNSSGALSPITLLGGTPPFVYTLTYPSGNSTQQTVNGYSNQFQGLSAGTYTLTIANGPCVFTNTYTINNTEKYTLTTSTTGTICQGSNGSISLTISSGATYPITYQVTGQPTISNTTQTAVTFNNLFAGIYQVTVTDAQFCTQSQTVTVNATDSIDFTLVGTNLTGTNNGTIQLYIIEGPAPYTIQWSSNVNGQTGTTLTNLSAGTYTVLVTDANGCQLGREFTLLGYNNKGGYEIYNYCQSEFISEGLTILKKPQQMFLEGFYDLTSGETNCVLNEAVFTAVVEVNGTTVEEVFYTSNSLMDYPSDNVWFDTIESIIESFSVIGNVIINPSQNSITVESNCTEQALSLNNAEISVDFKISYDISCVCKIEPTPGPYFNNCDVIYLEQSQQIYNYVYSSNTSTLLSVDGYNYNSPSIAFTDSKMWTYTTSAGSTTIREWSISLNPFTAVYNRAITLNFAIGNAIGVKSPNVLITTNSEVTPNRYVEIDISGSSPVVTNKANLVPNDEVIGSIVNDNNGILYVLMTNTASAPFNNYYLKLVSSSNYSNLYIIDLTLSIAGEPAGLFINPSISNYNVNIVDITGSIYQLSLTSPFGIAPLGTIAGSGVVYSLYQVNTCFTPQILLPAAPCGDDILTSWLVPDVENAGAILNQRINIGTNTGVSEMTVGFASKNIRYQILWNGNIVADSLFLTDSTGPSAHITDIQLVTGITQWYNFIYTPGTGTSTYAFTNTDWTDNGITNLQFTPDDCADESALRLFGSAGNQIGVVPSYPSAGASADDSDIKLQFTKTLAYPDYVDVVIYGAVSTDALITSGSFRNIIRCL
jgi:hypothetical protein